MRKLDEAVQHLATAIYHVADRKSTCFVNIQRSTDDLLKKGNKPFTIAKQEKAIWRSRESPSLAQA